jgi:hypothetical protein
MLTWLSFCVLASHLVFSYAMTILACRSAIGPWPATSATDETIGQPVPIDGL